MHVAVRKLLARFGDEVGSITTTGHSLGGALATLCAFDLVPALPLFVVWHDCYTGLACMGSPLCQRRICIKHAHPIQFAPYA